MWAPNIKVEDTPGQMELVYNPYKNSLDNILDSNIHNIVASIINMNPCILR